MRKLWILPAVVGVALAAQGIESDGLRAQGSGKPVQSSEIRVSADLRTPQDLRPGKHAWKFKLGDRWEYRRHDFDDSQWRKIKSLPHNWRAAPTSGKPESVGWYRIAMRFPSGSDGRELMLRVGPVMGADELYFNGVLIGSTGRIDPSNSRPARLGYDKLRFYAITPNLIRFGERNVIAVRVQPAFAGYAGFTDGQASIVLGHVAVLRNGYYKDNLPSLLICTVLLTVGAYFLLLFARRRHTYENLWFALTCFAFGSYYILVNQLKYVISDDVMTWKRMEYMLVFIQVQIFMNFNYAYFPREKSRGDKIRRVMVLFSNAVGLVSLCVPLVVADVDFWNTWNVLITQPGWLISIIVIFWLQISWAWRGNLDARLMLAAAVFGFAAFVNDILVQRQVLPGVVVGHYGFFIFVLSLAAILANRFVRLHNDVEELNVGLENRVAQRTSELKTALDSLNEAREETDKIMKTVDEGLFLVYPVNGHYAAGREYSAAVSSIFEELHDQVLEDPAIERFVFRESGESARTDDSTNMPPRLGRLLESTLGRESWEAFSEYARLLFNPSMDDGLVEQVNPLGRVKFDFHDSETGWARRKYLRFQFRRIRREKAIAHVMVQVRDVTAEVELERRLEEKEKDEKSRMRRLTELLQVEPAMLAEFIEDVRAELEIMKEALETFPGPDDRRERLNAVFRSLHTIKGNAALLNMTTFADRAHQHEEEIARLLKLARPEPGEEDRMNKGPREIGELMEEVGELFNRLKQFQERFEISASEQSGKENLLTRTLKETAGIVAREVGKKIEVLTDGMDGVSIPRGRRKLVKDVLVQLVRNSAAHGIELPDVRSKRGKPEQGSIRIHISPEGASGLRIDVSDDGGGLNVESLRKRAVDTGAISAETAASMTDRESFDLIFLPGLSTARSLSLSAGRGVGMDVVKKALDHVGGEIQVYSEAGKNCIFKILLPE